MYCASTSHTVAFPDVAGLRETSGTSTHEGLMRMPKPTDDLVSCHKSTSTDRLCLRAICNKIETASARRTLTDAGVTGDRSN